MLRCPDAQDATRPADDSNKDDLPRTLCNKIGSGPLITAPIPMDCGNPQCPERKGPLPTSSSGEESQGGQYELAGHSEGLQEQQLDANFSEPFHIELENQLGGGPPKPAEWADQRLRDAAFEELRRDFGDDSQMREFRARAATNHRIEKNCYTPGGKGFRVVTDRAEQGGEEMEHQQPDEAGVRCVVRRKVGGKVDPMGEGDNTEANDKVRKWLDAD